MASQMASPSVLDKCNYVLNDVMSKEVGVCQTQELVASVSEIFGDILTAGGDGNVPDALSDTETIHMGNTCSTSTTFRVDSVPA